MNDLHLSPKQQGKHNINGVKLSSKSSSQSSWSAFTSNTNGQKHHDNDNFEKGLPVFAKPFKIPTQPDHSSSKNRQTNVIDYTPSNNHGGKDVESILKMMTSTLEPLTKIAATPRTDIDVQTPNKPYVYANLPPLLRATINNCNNSK